jgi:hypothetical protein
VHPSLPDLCHIQAINKQVRVKTIRMSKQNNKHTTFTPCLRYLRCSNFLGTLIGDPFGTAGSLSINPYTCDGRRSIYANSPCIS